MNSFSDNETLDSCDIEIMINSKNYKKTEDYKKIIKNINYCKKVITKYIKWKDLIFLVNKCLQNLNNYCKILEDLIKKTNNNFDWELNFELFQANPELNNSFQTFKNTINNKNIQKVEKISFNFLKSIENINIKDILNLNSSKNVNDSETKIEKMKKIKLIHKDEDKEKINLEYTCFSPLNYNNYMLFGNNNGEVEIYNFMGNNEKYKLNLRIKAFNEEVKNICELDEDLFAVSGSKNEIKIIECKKDISQSSVIQDINITDNDKTNIYLMIYLPLLSSKSKKHFFCIATDKNIFIYKSNKTPKNLDILDNENNQENLSFQLYKTIELNTLTHCLIEADKKYLIASCPNENTIIFFDMTKDFTQVANITDINVTRGNNIFTVMPNEKKLIVACEDGFKIISIETKRKFKTVHCTYSVLCLDMFNDNTIICCCSEKNTNRNIIKQYKIKSNFELEKKSQRKNTNNEEIWKLQKIDEKIFFIDNKKTINYLI